jgi:hypothetical protein
MSPRWSPCPRRVFIRRLKRLGFEGPLPGGNHAYMVGREHRIAIPSNVEYSVDQVRRLLRQVERALDRRFTLQDWLDLEK